MTVPRPLRTWLALAVVLAIVAGIRVRLLELPLERDEGEYAYAGQLMLQGVPPYLMAYNMKWPGTYAAYAGVMAVFGETIAGIHVGVLLVNLLTAVLVFLLSRRPCGQAGAVVAAGTYALLSISPPTLGLAGHATHFVILPALGGVLLVRDAGDATRPWRVFGAGVLIGLSMLAKQTGAAFGAFAALWLAWQELHSAARDWRRLGVRIGALALGALLPLAATCAALLALGVFDRFWHWTFDYARAYASVLTLAEGAQNLWDTTGQLFSAAPGLWLLALVGLVALWTAPSVRDSRAFLSGFAAFSFLAACPGGYFRGHYFLLSLPAAGALAGVAVRATAELLSRAHVRLPSSAIAATLFGLASLQSLWESRAIFFQLDPAQACRKIYGTNPFAESIEIARFIEQHTHPNATIAVIGSEPQIYFYSRRRSATGHIYTYALMEPQPFAGEMQEEMIREIERENPRYTVFVSVASSWKRRPESQTRIFDWFARYQKKGRLVALVEIFSATETRYRWSMPPNARIAPKASAWVAIFENPAGR